MDTRHKGDNDDDDNDDDDDNNNNNNTLFKQFQWEILGYVWPEIFQK